MLDDMPAFLHAWWTTSPVSWDSEFFTLPPVHVGLRPVQAGGPPISTQSYPASNLITRRTLGWEPGRPSLLADLDNGHYFPAG